MSRLRELGSSFRILHHRGCDLRYVVEILQQWGEAELVHPRDTNRDLRSRLGSNPCRGWLLHQSPDCLVTLLLSFTSLMLPPNEIFLRP